MKKKGFVLESDQGLGIVEKLSLGLSRTFFQTFNKKSAYLNELAIFSTFKNPGNIFYLL